ncbi:MAG TPA: insulinase family protein, partial [Allosphingosinicella sp.]
MRFNYRFGLLVRLASMIALVVPLPLRAQADPGPSDASTTSAQAHAGAASPPLDDVRPVLQGQLRNGLRYVVVPRRTNEPGVGLHMQVTGGFLAERRPGERGLAHLVEHLAFHSATRAAPEDVQRFRTVGMPLTLPEPAGGTTTWRESDYYVVSRTNDPADIETLLGLFREVAGELIFRADAVDEQRAEVAREMADKRLGNESSARFIAAVAPGSPTDVIQAQNSDDVATASLDTIRALYHRLYRPETTSVVIVGDVDPRQMAAAIERRFGDWRGVGPPPGRVAVPTFEARRIAPFSHSALAEGPRSATITSVAPLPPPPRTRRLQAEGMLMDMLAVRAVGRRLAQTQAPGPPGKYGMFIENGEHGHRLMIFWDRFEPGGWRPAVEGLRRTVCDLAVQGLSEREWGDAKQRVIEELELQGRHMPNSMLAGRMADALAIGRDPIPPAELLRRARTWLPTVAASTMNRWWRRQ